MTAKTDKMIDLTTEILTRTGLMIRKGLKNVLTRHLSQLEANTKQDGYSVASSRFPSYFSKNRSIQ